jgi:hypothetical protein
MTVPRLIVFAFLSFSSSLFAEVIPVELLQEDFRIMRNALEEAHGGIYRYTSKVEVDRTFDRAFRKIDHPMTDLEFWRLIAPVVIQIKCGHTSAWFPKRLQDEFLKTTPFLPFEMRVLGDHIFVFQDYSDGSPFEGSELTSINDVPVKKILAQLRELFTGDGNSTTAKDWRIGHNAGLTACLCGIGIQGPFRITYRDRNGRRGQAELAGMIIPDRTKAWEKRNPPTTNFNLEFIDDEEIAILTIRHWEEYADEKRKMTFSAFLKESFAQIREKRTTNLIIDVRGNPGGLDAPGKQLFAFLWDKPFYYDTGEWKKTHALRGA